MYRVFLVVALLLTLSVLASFTHADEPVQIALAPVPVSTDAMPDRSNRMLSMLSERVKKLKEAGKDKEAKSELRRAHQRVRESEAGIESRQEKLHSAVERIGKGQKVNLDFVKHPKLSKDLAELQKEAKKLIKADKPDAAAKLADGMHKTIREGLIKQQKRFETIHEDIEKIGRGEYVAAGGEGSRRKGRKAGAGKHAKGDHDEAGHDHAHDHGHDHDGEIEEMLEELEEIQDELKEIREMVREIRGMVK